MNMGYEAAGKDIDDLLDLLDAENLTQATKDLKQKVRDALKKK